MTPAPPPGDVPAGDVRIGVSSCLLGEKVRFDGGHKRDAFLVGTLSRFVEWVPVCPELELGLGAPRESLRLERGSGVLRLMAPRSGIDHTRAMQAFARRRVRELERLRLDGFVLKKDSPSCGMERVRVHGGGSTRVRDGRGLFAAALLERLPELPAEEEGRLHDPSLRDNFVERVFAYRRLQDLFAGRWSIGGLVRHHTAHKLQLLAHSPQAYRSLGRLVAEARTLDRGTLRRRYSAELMAALRVQATAKRHANVLEHMLGYLRDRVPTRDRRELSQLIRDYRLGLLPLIVPITLLRHHVERLPVDYLLGQHYLQPHPKELMLRNHV